MKIHTPSSSLDETLSHVAHWLPTQGPIKEFIHHNTLHAYQHRPYFEGLRVAAEMVGSFPTPRLELFRQLHREGVISDEAVFAAASALEREAKMPPEMLRAQALDPAIDVPRYPSIVDTGYRARLKRERGMDLDAQTHPLLFRWLGQYLDQGISVWRMPESPGGLWDTMRGLARESLLPIPLLRVKGAKRLLELSADQAIDQALKRLLGSPTHATRYLAEVCLAQPGWAGMVRVLETFPESVLHVRKVTLKDWVALTLAAEVGALESALGADFSPLSQAGEAALPIPADQPAGEPSRAEWAGRVWQLALEKTYSQKLLSQLLGPREVKPRPKPQIQTFFCIDDRECSIRRHLEALDPAVETFAWAGFFAVDCVFKGSDDRYALKHCPVPVTPKHQILELARGGDAEAHRNRTLTRYMETGGHGFSGGWLIAHTLGFWAGLRLVANIFKPAWGPASVTSLSRVDQQADLKIERSPGVEKPNDHGFWEGYTPNEMADRVNALLIATGALALPTAAQQKELAPLLVFFGHGASSSNNPYFSAYDCGACSGKPGAPNARAFAKMANHPEVRKILATRGVRIPEGTQFVGALHDTTRDEVQYYDTEILSAANREALERLKQTMQRALEVNAQERCRKFTQAPQTLSPAQALEHVKLRSEAIFEARPEYNHATNAAAIVARRSVSLGTNLDRRAFLNSYDPANDASGDILANILGAVVPVCGGISLEYLFSRMDPLRYGSGSKLPQNVIGLLGVAQGTDGDLLTGLPAQMTEIHDPQRLSIVVEQAPDTALKAVMKNPAVYEWVLNGWVQYFSITPDITPGGGKAFEWKAGEMKEVVWN